MADNHHVPPIIVGDRVQQLDMLLHVQEFSSMVVLITGEPQVGKSHLLSAALHQLSIHHQTILFSSEEITSNDQLLMKVAQQLGSGASWPEIDSRLLEVKEQGDSLVLLVDDAHLLSEEVLTQLVSKSLVDSGWHLILSGDNEIRSKSEKVEGDLQASNLFHLIHLLPFTEEESDQFIQLYFKQSGKDSLPISQKAMHQLWLLSKGNTGKLVELLESQLEKQREKNSQFPLGHIAAVLLIGSALLFSFLYQDDEKGIEEDPISDLLAIQASKDKALGFKSDIKNIEFEPPQDPVKLSEAESDTVIEEKLSTTDKAQAASSKVDSNPRVISNPPEISKVVSKPEPIKAPSPSHPLLLASSKSYVLQLVGVRNQKSAQAVAERLGRELKTDKVTFYETIYKNAPWFVVVYGPIDDKVEAESTAKSISRSIKNEPWIRPIAKIQEDIRKNTP